MIQKKLSGEERRQLWLRLAIRVGLCLLVVALCIWAVPPLFSLLAPFVFALLVAALLNPVIHLLQRKLGWGRGVFTILVLSLMVALLGGGIFALGYVAVGETLALVDNWETVIHQVTQVMEQLDALMDTAWGLVPPALSSNVDAVYLNILSWIEEVTPALLERAANGVGSTVGGVPSFLLALLIFVLATYFITADYPYLRSRMASGIDEGLLQFMRDVRQTALAAFGGYLKAQLLLSVGVFFILLAGFVFIQQPYGMLLALGLSVLDFIPILGSGTVMVPWAFIALFTGEFVDAVEIMVIWGIIALFRRIAEPKFVGNQTGLSPVLSLVSIYVGMKLGGVMGMIFGPILALVFLNLCELGVFRGLVEDVVIASRDVAQFLKRP